MKPLPKKNVPIVQKKQQGLRITLPDTRLMRYIVTILFFTCFFVFVLRYINPAIVYSSNGVNIHNYVIAMHAQKANTQRTVIYEDPQYRQPFILELTPEYFHKTVFIPGGLTRFVVTLCIYACHYPLLGALTLTAVTLFFFWIFLLYSKGLGLQRPFVIGFIPSFFLLTICAWYELSYSIYLLPIAGALAFAAIYQRFRPTDLFARALYLSLLFWAAWYLFLWGSLLVILFVMIHEFFNRERRIAATSVVALVNSLLLFVLNTWLLPLNMTIRWLDFTILYGLPLAITAFFPIAAIIMAMLGRREQKNKTKENNALGWIVLLVCITVMTTIWLCREPVNRDTRTFARTVYHITNAQWNAILHENTTSIFADFPKKGGGLQAFMIHGVDHALCRTGQVGDRLFSYPQKVFPYDPLFMLQNTLTGGFVNWVVVLELAMDLGMVNTAEKIAGEIMENMGPFPDIIYRRALIQIAKGNNEVASVYLNKLAFSPFYRSEAKRLLTMVDNNESFASESRIASMRANMDTGDYYLFTISYDAMLKHLLQSNPGNKMAYDYLMTFCIYTGQLGGLATLAPAAPAFGYAALPRCWEEALCVNLAASSTAPSEASFSGLHQGTVERFNEFVQTCSAYADDSIAAAKLAPLFGDSYFYFSIFKFTRGVHHD